MTTNQNVTAPIDADRAKKLAHNLKSRFADLGVKICLNHGYEAVAALHSYPNWATMKASLEKGASDRQPSPPSTLAAVKPPVGRNGLTIGREIPSNREIVIPSLRCLDHFYVGGPSGKAKNGILLGLAEGTLQQGQGFMLCDSSEDSNIVSRVWALASQYGKGGSVSVIDCRGGESRYNPEIFKPLKAWAFAEIICDVMCGQDDTEITDQTRVEFMTLLAAAYEGHRWLDRAEPRGLFRMEEFLKMLEYRTLHWAAFGDEYASLPDSVRKLAARYLRSIGVVGAETVPEVQPTTVMNLHARNVKQVMTVIRELDRYRLGAVNLWDIDFGAVVDSGAVLVVLLPHVEHVGDTSSAPGAVVHSAFAEWLNERSKKGIARSKRRQQPFLAIFDEVDGYEVRTRSGLGHAATLSGISLAFCDLNGLEPKEMGSSNMTGIFMRDGGNDFIRTSEGGCPAVLMTHE